MPKQNNQQIRSTLENKFHEIFKHTDHLHFIFAPGRVNLIGEHTDYNGGNVFPIALDIGTYLVIAPRKDEQLRLCSLNFENIGLIHSKLSQHSTDKTMNWANYVIGVLLSLSQQGYKLTKGFDLLVYGNIPDGAGLSSSASLSVGLTFALNDIENFHLDKIEIAKIAQQAEHFVGVQCGIMDQFASAMGKKDYGILLDCNTLIYEYVPINLDNYTLMIMDSQKQRQLAESKYNERRQECETALALLQQELPIKSLGELSEQQWEQYSYLIKDPIILKRARHAITENQRTLKSLEALKNQELDLFGQLLNQSHYSLRDDYEVTGIELDSLTENARKFPGVLGSRMTGAGFGGCCIALIPKDSKESFIKEVGEKYHNQTGLTAKFYEASIGDGVHFFDTPSAL